MSLRTRKNRGKEYLVFTGGRGNELHLGPADDITKINSERVLQALDYVKERNLHYSEIEEQLIGYLPEKQKDQYISKRLKELDSYADKKLFTSLSEDSRTKYLEKRVEELQTRLRQIRKIRSNEYVAHTVEPDPLSHVGEVNRRINSVCKKLKIPMKIVNVAINYNQRFFGRLRITKNNINYLAHAYIWYACKVREHIISFNEIGNELYSKDSRKEDNKKAFRKWQEVKLIAEESVTSIEQLIIEFGNMSDVPKTVTSFAIEIYRKLLPKIQGLAKPEHSALAILYISAVLLGANYQVTQKGLAEDSEISARSIQRAVKIIQQNYKITIKLKQVFPSNPNISYDPKREKILLVDKIPDKAHELWEYLAKIHDYECMTYYDTKSALSFLKEEYEPDFVLIDYENIEPEELIDFTGPKHQLLLFGKSPLAKRVKEQLEKTNTQILPLMAKHETIVEFLKQSRRSSPIVK